MFPKLERKNNNMPQITQNNTQTKSEDWYSDITQKLPNNPIDFNVTESQKTTIILT
ncbi:hypothetical protein Deia_00742 [Candidatus Deianiraea vastatrix]|uniref:Uncharacterized protein n=1 Tax=Candidatus Deianiraea vastatrix TaxID=2163644 RepID=A0A5B8XDZ7_9RICK|nr:hypothetical protein Deia_00742 [Candidatus Deianiraea vastatrix]